ncbi:WD repeat-containing protein [Capsicum galapagoense]
MKTMQVEEVFFDSADYLEEPGSLKRNSGYDLWLMEPDSVNRRRENFLNEMGFVGFDCVHSVASDESDSMGLKRIVESSEAVCSSGSEEELLCNERESSGNANSLTDELDQTWFDDVVDVSSDCAAGSPDREHTCFDATSDHTDCKDSILKKQKINKWWKQFSLKMRKSQSTHDVSKTSKIFSEKQKVTPMDVQLNRKKINEFSAVFCGQEISAHSGLIWTMKFSPDGKYLASAGEDGVVRIWLVTVDSSCESPNFNFSSHRMKGKHGHKKKKSCYTPVIVPEKAFKIEESPLHEFHGHTAGILELAWSSSNCVLSSSKDKTVRLWQVGLDGCQGVFHHKNYVTCVQFNPVNENIFISGSIDGKVRIWGVPGKRVMEWADVHDIVTAIAYQPNGEGFIVGCISGTCRFYELKESVLSPNSQVHLHSRKKSSGSRITGIQFFEQDSRRVMITSEDSKIHILDGVEIVHKYKGLSKSGSHASATFSSTGKHIISVGEDSRVYLWDNDDISIQRSKHTKSIRSCEHFLSEGISIAIPWSGQATTAGDLENFGSPLTGEHQEASSRTWDSRRFSVGNWFSMDVSFRGSVTWPEEMLLPYDTPCVEIDEHLCTFNDDHLHQEQQHNKNLNYKALSAAWGLVIVTAGWDGKIRTFHNYGLPVRV